MSYINQEEWDKLTEEQKKQLLAKKQQELKGIEVSVDTEQMKQELEHHIETSKELERTRESVQFKFGEQMLSKLQAKCEELNIEWHEPQNVGDLHALIGACQEVEKAKRPSSVSAGQISLDSKGQQTSGKGKEYSSYEEMIDDLREQTHSRNEDERRKAEETINELFKKIYTAKMKGEISGGIKGSMVLPTYAEMQKKFKKQRQEQ